MPSSPKLRVILLVSSAALGLLVAVLVGAVVYDRASRPQMDFEPNRAPSALDTADLEWLHRPSEESSEESSEENDDGEQSAPAESCGPTDTLAERWIVIGWDGADWDLVLPLLREGRLPNLASLMKSGTYGTLASMVPTVSPAIWTTVATGTTPGEHGILHFYNQQPILTRWWQRLRHFGELRRELFTNADRRRHAIWNLAGRDRSVMVVGYHNTFPVEPVNGMMVSNYLMQDSVAQTMSMEAGAEENDLASSLVHPLDDLRAVLDLQKEVQRRIPEIVQRFADVPEDERNDFLRASLRIDPEGDQKPYFLVHAWLFDEIVAQVADAFYGKVSPDLAMVHFQAVDWAAHRFLYYHSPELYDDREWSPEVRERLAAETERYRGTVDAFYVYLDQWLGRFLAHRDERTAVLLMSDHGFEPSADPEIPGGHDHAPPGIVVLQGPGIRPGHRLEGADIYDVMPTLMAGLGLPVAEDLRGEVLTDAFCDAVPRDFETTATYSTGAPYVPEISRPEALDEELLQQMKSLGYIQ